MLLASSAACAQTYDLVISGGRVIDPESRLDAVRNVGIRDGKVAVISRGKLAGNRVIDAKGLVVAPGFIDLHSHAVMALPAARMQVMDGVTTALELESGVLPVAATYDLLAKEGRPLNYGFSVAWTFARASIAMGKPARDFSTADWGPTVVPIGKDFTNRTNRVAFLKSSSWAYGRARSAVGRQPRLHAECKYRRRLRDCEVDPEVRWDADILLHSPQGIRHVIVNGVSVVSDGELIRDARPGQPIRRTPVRG